MPPCQIRSQGGAGPIRKKRKHCPRLPSPYAVSLPPAPAWQLAAWRTSNVRRSKPTAEGEARNGLMVIEETCWDAVPEHYRRLDRALRRIGQPPVPYDKAIVIKPRDDDLYQYKTAGFCVQRPIERANRPPPITSYTPLRRPPSAD